MHPYVAHLSKEKKLKRRIEERGEVPIKKKKNVPLRLCASIMSQQLSVKVAAVIYKRFLQLYGGKEPKPQQILDTPPETLRAIGLSNAKVSYVHNVARFVIEEKLTDARLHKLDNDEAIAYLTRIKGVGRWTVEMLLMFYLGREDVFACDDLGLQLAMNKLYKLDTTDKKTYRAKIMKLSEKWAPYRTHACRYLWAWKDAVPVT